MGTIYKFNNSISYKGCDIVALFCLKIGGKYYDYII